jgi:eukaryotic-like serine/threonine-protein kinase
MESYYEFTMFLSFLVRNGRAVLFPVYKGTFERSSPELAALHQGNDSHAYSEYFKQMVQDFHRSVDYLESRPDIDRSRLAYYGMSVGAFLGPIITAVDDRLKASVLLADGLDRVGRPEANLMTYAGRVRTPTLMLNGRYDTQCPPDECSRPLPELLGTAAGEKRFVLYETDHIPPRTEYIKETLAWLDRWLGPVAR